MRKQLKSKIYLLSISFAITIIDQFSKYIAEYFIKDGNQYKFLPYLINIRISRNTGAAFSILSDKTNILTITSLIVSLALIIWIIRKGIKLNYKTLGISFLLGGSLGNGIDRLVNGYVIDFIQIVPINFPIFNIADISINIAIFFLAIYYFRMKV
tara:strand:+ start:2391 stop:2855 length:465 start_codon:yes stop_codon:yes gene_type:complete